MNEDKDRKKKPFKKPGFNLTWLYVAIAVILGWLVMNKGTVAMDGTPAQVMCNVEELRDIGLDVPDTVSLLYELRQRGFDVPLDALSVEDCAEAILRLGER